MSNPQFTTKSPILFRKKKVEPSVFAFPPPKGPHKVSSPEVAQLTDIPLTRWVPPTQRNPTAQSLWNAENSKESGTPFG